MRQYSPAWTSSETVAWLGCPFHFGITQLLSNTAECANPELKKASWTSKTRMTWPLRAYQVTCRQFLEGRVTPQMRAWVRRAVRIREWWLASRKESGSWGRGESECWARNGDVFCRNVAVAVALLWPESPPSPHCSMESPLKIPSAF